MNTGKRQRAIQKAENLRDRLPLVEGMQPNPCELRVTIDPPHIDTYRYFECPLYKQCVNIASIAFWEALTCKACPIFCKHVRKKKIRRFHQRLRYAKAKEG